MFEREYALLQADSSDANLAHFFITANHIKDYFEHTKIVEKDEIDSLASRQDLVDCETLCDKAKHHTLNRNLKKRPNPTTWIWSGEIGGAPVGGLEIGAGDKRVMFSGDRVVDVGWLADRVMKQWREFFLTHKLL